MTFKIGQKVHSHREGCQCYRCTKTSPRYWAGKKRPNFSGKNHPLYGKKVSVETRAKMRESHRGKKGWSKGLTKEINVSLNKMSLKNKGKHRSPKTEFKKGQHLGEKNPAFNNWSSREPYGKEWSPELKEQIRTRDNFRCQQCFRHQDELFTQTGRKRKLTVHHIDYNKKNCNPNNLIALCHNCHMQTNYKRADWTNYFQNHIGGLS